MRRLLSVFALIAIPAALMAEDAKPTAEKLVGTWKLSKSETPLPPNASATIDFTKDGKLNMKIEVAGQKLEMPGTWKLDGSKLKVKQSGPDGKEKEETMEIKSLTDSDLVTIDEKGKKDEFTKVKK